ncbi:MAG TPA: arabinofuranosidase catalytic domain-containing protein [Bacteroidales bacterium]|nr:arabinofuranosidase catalytic domain-containing protein [Bacteroidales bacterium]
MKLKNLLLVGPESRLIFSAGLMLAFTLMADGQNAVPSRPQGPCDIYAAEGCPCVAAHSSTRALYSSYNGPLYQVMRQSDGRTLDIGVVKPTAGDPGGYADAAAQDEFCADTYCWITILYDQSGKGNHLTQAPRGGFSGPAMGGFNNLPIADMAPVTLMGHKVYGIFIEPGMGLRDDDPVGTAVDDQAEGQYWVINGHHYNSGCCFDYGNAEIDSRDDGDGTMETTYYGNATAWYHGQAPGPWIMTDQENNLVGCVNESPNDKYCPELPSISWRFVTATADGEPNHWRAMGGDAQGGELEIMFDGPRIINERSSYDPMRKQGAILLGNGGDNSVGSQGTFYEAAMTAPGTFPTRETNQKIQDNIVAAGYDVQSLSIAPSGATDTPPGLQTFSPQTSQNTTVTFTNTTGNAIRDLSLSISVPQGWKAVVLNSDENARKFTGLIGEGETVSSTFTVTSGLSAFNGDIVGRASWTNIKSAKSGSETVVEKVRNVSPVKINEFRVSDGSPQNSSNTFIELYNAGDREVDISGWELTHHPTQMPIFSSVEIPAGTKLSARGFYLLGLSNSGLAVPAKKGESTIFVRTTEGMSVGDVIEIGTGSTRETRTITGIRTPPEPEAAASPFGGGRRGGQRGLTTVWQPLPDGPVVTIPAGSTNIPVTSVVGFEAGQKMAIGYGATYPTVSRAVEKYEVVTITSVGKPGTQGWLSMDAKAGDRNIKVSSVENITAGDKIRLDIDSKGHGIETVTVKRVGTRSSRSTFNGPLTEDDDPGTGLDLSRRLKYDHASNLPFSAWGTGISFKPATAFAHSSNEPVLALGNAVTLDKPLSNDHEIDAVVRDGKVTTAGYQGTREPDQWFGGPALSTGAGNMVLRDAEGNVVDGLNYGGLVDPWAAEGYQAKSGAGESGCSVPSPGMSRGFRMGASAAAAQPDRSAGRFPDGYDRDSNCSDFRVQDVITLLTSVPSGADNIKIADAGDFSIGQKVIIGTGNSCETGIITIIGTTGGTSVGTATSTGTTVIPVAGVAGFTTGQTITIDSGDNLETAVIASISMGRRRFGSGQGAPADTLKVTRPLKLAHAAGAQVSGSGITLAKPLTKPHESGTPVACGLPTPGGPNIYTRRP